VALKPEDFQSQAWKRLADELNERLAALRLMNDQPTLNSEQTSLIRGKIMEIKRILALGKPSASEAEDAD